MTTTSGKGWASLASLPVTGLLVASACAAPDPAPSPAELIDRMALALGGLRPIEARLSGGVREEFSWAPCERVESSPDALLEAALTPLPDIFVRSQASARALGIDAEAPDLVPAARCSTLPSDFGPGGGGEALYMLGPFLSDSSLDGSSAAYRARGLWSLVHGDAARALPYLQRAAETAVGPVETGKTSSDLAAAYLEAAASEDRPDYFARALDAAQTGVEAWPEGSAGWFNRALAMEGLGLGYEAAEAWEDVLNLAEPSAWSDEARDRLQRLTQPSLAERWSALREDIAAAAAAGDGETVRLLVAEAVTPARQWGEDELLGRWADARAAGDAPGAASALAVAGAVGRALVELGGDALLADTVAEIESAASDLSREALLIRGLRAYARGKRAEKTYSDHATGAFLESEEALLQADSLFVVRPMVQRWVADYRASRLLLCIDALHRVEAAVEGDRYPAVMGRIAWLRGLCHGGSAQPAEAMEDYRRGITHYRAGGEPGLAGYLLALLSEYQAAQRDPEMAWRSLYPALHLRHRLVERRRHHVVLDQGQELATAETPEVRLILARALVGLERLGSNPVDDVHARLRLHETLVELGVLDEAEALLMDASWAIESLDESRVRRRLEVDVASARARLLAQTDPRGARDFLASTLAYYQEGDRRFESPRLLRLDAALAVEVGDRSAALGSLERAFAVTESQLEATDEPGLLTLHGRTLAETAREWVALLVEEERFLEALWVVQRSKARDLLEVARRAHPATAPRERSVAELAAELPSKRTVVEYLSLPEELIAWVIRRNGVTWVRLPVPRERLRAEAEAIRRAAQAGNLERARGLWAVLAEAILDPLALGPETPTVLGDDALHGLPLPALLDETGATSFEKVPVIPSLTFHVAMLERRRRFGTDFGGGPVLILGNPYRAGGRLSPLPGAEEEALRVGGELGVEPLVGRAAHREAFVERAGWAEVIYFAGHAQNNAQRPELSFLALAPSPDGNDDGILHAYEGNVYAHEIARMDLSRVRRVVLMGCSTAGEGGVGERGMTLAHAFLAAGVGEVEATLLEIRDIHYK